MNNDFKELQQSLLRLLQDLGSGDSLAINEALSLKALQGNAELDDLPLDTLDSPHQTDLSSETYGQDDLETSQAQRNYSLRLGETPTVQNRFYALLKRRLKSEIQLNPPLFPWETEIQDYEAGIARSSVLNTSASTQSVAQPVVPKVPVLLWLNHLKTLNLPVPVPETVLLQLLQRCQEIAQSSFLEGAKLVRAVEDLFPNQPQLLNHLAGLVMASPARSGSPVLAEPDTSYPQSYESALPAQQMLLSLMAAREILAALTLNVSQSQRQVTQHWLTELGQVTLQVAYEAGQTTSQLKLSGQLPCSGSLILHYPLGEKTVNILENGVLSLELQDVLPPQSYFVEVQLSEWQQSPLLFTVRVLEA